MPPRFRVAFLLICLALDPTSARAQVGLCLKPAEEALAKASVAREETPRLFDVRDLEVENGEKFFFRAELIDGGGIEPNVATKDLATGLRSRSLYAQRLFDEMIRHFSRRSAPLRFIAGNWIDGTNLATLNEQTRRGVPLAQAALHTWTGRQARRHGYGQVRVISAVGAPGRYTDVSVEFHR